VKNPAHAPNQNMVIQPPPKQFMTISNPKMKLTFSPQYCNSSKASNINLKPEKHNIRAEYVLNSNDCIRSSKIMCVSLGLPANQS